MIDHGDGEVLVKLENVEDPRGRRTSANNTLQRPLRTTRQRIPHQQAENRPHSTDVVRYRCRKLTSVKRGRRGRPKHSLRAYPDETFFVEPVSL